MSSDSDMASDSGLDGFVVVPDDTAVATTDLLDVNCDESTKSPASNHTIPSPTGVMEGNAVSAADDRAAILLSPSASASASNASPPPLAVSDSSGVDVVPDAGENTAAATATNPVAESEVSAADDHATDLLSTSDSASNAIPRAVGDSSDGRGVVVVPDKNTAVATAASDINIDGGDGSTKSLVSSAAVPDPMDEVVENGDVNSNNTDDVDRNKNVTPPAAEKETSTRENGVDDHTNETAASDQTKLQTTPDEATTTDANATDNGDIKPSMQKRAMEMNVALEALESMRRLNLEVEFSNATNCFSVDHNKCTYCQREALHKFIANPPPPKPVVNGNAAVANGERGITIGKVKLDGSRMRRFRGNVGNFFAKSAPLRSEINDDGSMKSSATQSCPPSLFSPSSKSTSSMESFEGSASDTNGSSTTTTNSNRASRRNILKKTVHPCLTCGHPTCSKHSQSNFTKSHIPICQPCAYLFELNFLVDIIASTASEPKECRRKVDDMVDCYDRAKLLLTYTAQYADEIAEALESSTVRSNKIGVGSSATGIASGVAGVVGCGVLLIPPVAVAGVPLLIASLVFGGGATAVQSGDAAAKHFSEPNKLAEKMVALHGMVLSLLRITEVLSYGLLKSHLGVNYSVEGMSEEGEEGKDEETMKREALAKEINELLEKHGVSTTAAAVGGLQSAVASGIVATELAAAGAIAGTEAAVSASSVASGATMVGRGSRYFGRVGTTAASGARFIPIAGGLLSAACVVVEGRELKRTLSKINEGNQCAKAEQVRSIRDELCMLPESSLIATEADRVFELARREKEKQAELVENDRAAKQGLKMVGADVTMQDVSQGDISDLIDVMETTARLDALNEDATES